MSSKKHIHGVQWMCFLRWETGSVRQEIVKIS